MQRGSGLDELGTISDLELPTPNLLVSLLPLRCSEHKCGIARQFPLISLDRYLLSVHASPIFYWLFFSLKAATFLLATAFCALAIDLLAFSLTVLRGLLPNVEEKAGWSTRTESIAARRREQKL